MAIAEYRALAANGWPVSVWLITMVIGATLIGISFMLGRLSAVRHNAKETFAELEVAQLAVDVVRNSRIGIAVLNRLGAVVLSNQRAADLSLIVDDQIDRRIARLVSAVAENGKPAITTFAATSSTRQSIAVHAEISVLNQDFLLVHATDESESARLEETRRDFVANVSHELKTPVGALALLAEAILNAADDQDEVRRFSAKIMHEATRLGRLVSELIALSRLQGAERLPDMTPVNIDSVVSEAIARSQLVAEAAEIDVATDEPSQLWVSGDRTLLVTALSNLLDNAVAYSQQGSPVSISRRLNNDFVEIAVTDRGMGIAKEQQVRVFERFYRIDTARSRVTGGTGLGLAIVKHVAANHGGEVTLWSELGTGSTFTLRIPVLREKM